MGKHPDDNFIVKWSYSAAFQFKRRSNIVNECLQRSWNLNTSKPGNFIRKLRRGSKELPSVGAILSSPDVEPSHLV